MARLYSNENFPLPVTVLLCLTNHLPVNLSALTVRYCKTEMWEHFNCSILKFAVYIAAKTSLAI